MQNPVAPRKWSDIKGLAVVTLGTGQKVGTVDDFYFDTVTRRVLGFVVKVNLFNSRVLRAKDVNNVGTDAITFASEDNLIKESEDESLKALFLGRDILHYRVLSEGGTVIGTIDDVFMDITIPTQIVVTDMELAGGLKERITGHHATFAAEKVASYGKDVIVIPDSVAQLLQK